MLSAESLNPTDKVILNRLAEHPMTPAKIANDTEYSGGNIRNRLSYLVSHNHVETIGGGMYKLVSDPRETSTQSPADGDQNAAETESADTAGSQTDATQLQQVLTEARRHVNAAEAAAARGDRGELEQRLSQASAVLDTD